MTTTSTDNNDLCSSLGLSGMGLAVCQSLEKTPLTANLVYKILERIEPKFPILTDNLEDIIQNNLVKIIVQNAILQQIPWLLGFLLITLSLLITKTITISAFILLLIIATSITIIIVGFNLYSIRQQSKEIVKQVKSQIKSNVSKFKGQLI